MRQYYTYIMSNRSRTLYIGMTNNLEQRVYQHKHKLFEGFTSNYNLDLLVFYEVFEKPFEAIGREKQLKGWKRDKKIELIEKMNPGWIDLSQDWVGIDWKFK